MRIAPEAALPPEPVIQQGGEGSTASFTQLLQGEAAAPKKATRLRAARPAAAQPRPAPGLQLAGKPGIEPEPGRSSPAARKAAAVEGPIADGTPPVPPAARLPAALPEGMPASTSSARAPEQPAGAISAARLTAARASQPLPALPSDGQPSHFPPPAPAGAGEPAALASAPALNAPDAALLPEVVAPEKAAAAEPAQPGIRRPGASEAAAKPTVQPPAQAAAAPEPVSATPLTYAATLASAAPSTAPAPRAGRPAGQPGANHGGAGVPLKEDAILLRLASADPSPDSGTGQGAGGTRSSRVATAPGFSSAPAEAGSFRSEIQSGAHPSPESPGAPADVQLDRAMAAPHLGEEPPLPTADVVISLTKDARIDVTLGAPSESAAARMEAESAALQVELVALGTEVEAIRVELRPELAPDARVSSTTEHWARGLAGDHDGHAAERHWTGSATLPGTRPSPGALPPGALGRAGAGSSTKVDRYA